MTRQFQILGNAIDAVLYMIVRTKANEYTKRIDATWIERGDTVIHRIVKKIKSNVTASEQQLESIVENIESESEYQPIETLSKQLPETAVEDVEQTFNG